MGALAGRIARVPLVVTSRRALATHQERHFLLRPFDLFANRLSHRVTVNSKAVWKDTVSRDYIDPTKLVLIHNGVDVQPFDSAQPFREEAPAYRFAFRRGENPDSVRLSVCNTEA